MGDETHICPGVLHEHFSCFLQGGESKVTWALMFSATQGAGICIAGCWGGTSYGAMLGVPRSWNVCIYKVRPSREQLLPGLEENGYTRGVVILREMESSGLARVERLRGAP